MSHNQSVKQKNFMNPLKIIFKTLVLNKKTVKLKEKHSKCSNLKDTSN